LSRSFRNPHKDDFEANMKGSVILNIGLDVGNGWTKVVYGSNYNAVKFPSVITNAQKLHSGDSLGDYEFKYNNETNFIGEAAYRSQSKFTKSVYGSDRIDSSVFMRLFLCGISATLEDDGEVDVVTGLPINFYLEHSKQIEDMAGKYTVKLNGKTIGFNVNSITCLPQSMGTYLKKVASTPELEKMTVLIIDSGMRDTDLLLISDNVPLSDSLSMQYGMSDIYAKIVRFINQKYDTNFSVDNGERLIKDGFMYGGRRIMVDQSLINNAHEELFETIWNKVRQFFPNYLSFDRIIWTGGTSIALEPYIQKIRRDSFIIEQDAQIANAVGFRYYFDQLS
jgi:hypothetical protein